MTRNGAAAGPGRLTRPRRLEDTSLSSPEFTVAGLPLEPVRGSGSALKAGIHWHWQPASEPALRVRTGLGLLGTVTRTQAASGPGRRGGGACFTLDPKVPVGWVGGTPPPAAGPRWGGCVCVCVCVGGGGGGGRGAGARGTFKKFKVHRDLTKVHSRGTL
jgi:hypothetical protein